MNRFRKAAVFLLCCSFTGTACTIWAQKPLSWSSATGAEHYERLMWQEIQAGNAKEIERRLASTFTMVDASGRVFDKPAALEELKQLRITDHTLGEFNVSPNGEDMVVTYIVELRGSWQGGAIPITRFRMMTVWQQATQGWQAIAHSSVPLAN